MTTGRSSLTRRTRFPNAIHPKLTPVVIPSRSRERCAARFRLVQLVGLSAGSFVTVGATHHASGHSRVIRVVGAASLAAVIFAVDMLTPADMPFASLYVLVLLVAGWDAGNREIAAWTAGSLFLSTVCFLWEVDLEHDIASDVRFGISLTAIGCTAVLVARHSAAEALRLSELRYRTIFNTLAVAICEYDFRPVREAIEAVRAGGVSDLRRYVAEHPEFVRTARRAVRVREANDMAVTLLGVPSRAEFFQTLSEILPDEDDSFGACLLAIDQGQTTFMSETKARTFNGDPLPVIVALSFPPGAGFDRITGCLVDLSDRIRMQATIDRTRGELDKALRAASLGELSASIAHEVNQPLSAVMSYAHAARRWLSREKPDLLEARAAVDHAISAAQTASEVIKRIRKLLGKIAPDRAPVLIETVISGAIRIIQNDAEAHGISVMLELSTPGVVVLGDRILLQQVLINLLSNAIQAMEAVSDRARQLVVESKMAGNMIQIRLVDTGSGLTGEAAARAFDAFYTTKARGTGLGLSICRSTIEAHDGSITLENNLAGPGAVVTIRFPASTSATAAQPSDVPSKDSTQPTSASPSTGFSRKHTAPVSKA